MGKNLYSQSMEAIDWGYAIDLTKQLVKIKSTSRFSAKADILQIVSEYLNGFDPQIVTPPNAAPYLVAQTRCKHPEFKLVLSGHLDTVDEGAMPGPFNPTVRDGMIYGRGTADMKAGCAAMMLAFKPFADLKGTRGDACLIFTLDEEISSDSIAHALTNELLRADLAIVGEPTGLALGIAHKGMQWIKVQFHGQSCHGSMPDCGRNAVVMAARFIAEMEEFTRKHFPQRDHPLLGLPTLTAGKIKGGGEFVNMVPDNCELMLDRRWNPNETLAQIEQDMNTILRNCELQDPDFHATWEAIGVAHDKIYPPLDFAPHKSLLQRLTSAIMASGYKEIRQSYLDMWTEGALFEKAGIPAIAFGPGDSQSAHTLEERVEIEQVVQAAKAYFTILLEMCG